MLFKSTPLTFLLAGLLSVPGMSSAQTKQSQTYAAVRQALIDGEHVMVTLDFGKCPGDPRAIKAGLAVRSFMVNDTSEAHVTFADLHTTVQRMGNSADGRVINEFVRYTVEPHSPKDTVTIDVYSWPLAATAAVLQHTTICQLGNGATFNW
jgi:hypothetical protein